jgi:hypothetical protein
MPLSFPGVASKCGVWGANGWQVWKGGFGIADWYSWRTRKWMGARVDGNGHHLHLSDMTRILSLVDGFDEEA